MSRKKLLAEVSAVGTYDLWGDLNRRIKNAEVIPFISNSVINNRIFDIDEDGLIEASRGGGRKDETHHARIDEELAREWADFIGYPLAEIPLQLAWVAQYNRVISDDNDQAKTNYLTFLKLYLLELAMDDEEISDLAESLVEPFRDLSLPEIAIHLGEQSFSELAFQLGYPRFEDEQQNPLHVLAQLPLPIYVTTSHHDFMERALLGVGKHPRTQVCSCFDTRSEPEWFGDPPTPEAEVEAVPSEGSPLVYHLYGLEKYPTSIVISEDDYIDFLIRVSEDRAMIPLKLRQAMAQSSLLLLGYRLRNWDFRVLFRGIFRTSRLLKVNLAIQLNPPVQEAGESSNRAKDYLNEARQYLEAYLEPSNFKVEWDSTTSFVQKLWQEWRKSQR